MMASNSQHTAQRVPELYRFAQECGSRDAGTRSAGPILSAGHSPKESSRLLNDGGAAATNAGELLFEFIRKSDGAAIPASCGSTVSYGWEAGTVCVIEGRGTFILDDARYPIETGGSIFIPENAWHGFENADRELLLLWIVAPPGLEASFREVATHPGTPATPRTKEQLNEIARKYGTESR